LQRARFVTCSMQSDEKTRRAVWRQFRYRYEHRSRVGFCRSVCGRSRSPGRDSDLIAVCCLRSSMCSQVTIDRSVARFLTARQESPVRYGCDERVPVGIKFGKAFLVITVGPKVRCFPVLTLRFRSCLGDPGAITVAGLLLGLPRSEKVT
jgi:hypothetical protein